MVRVFVTGGSGKAGVFIVNDLLDHGLEVVSVDRKPPREDGRHSEAADAFSFRQIDTTDFADVRRTMEGCDAVIHLSAIPNPISLPGTEVFRINMMSNWNVLEAAEELGIEKVVMASSVNAVGGVFSKSITPRPYFPIDEEQPTFCEDAYSQSKWLGEEMAKAFCRRRRLQVASMRFHGLWTIKDQAAWRSKVEFEGRNPANNNAKHFWGWTDISEAARACTLALEKDWEGHEAFFINSNDTNMLIPTMECIDKSYPNTELKSELSGFTTAISNSKAKRILNWEPLATWRNA